MKLSFGLITLALGIVAYEGAWAVIDPRPAPTRLKPGEYLAVPFIQSLERVASPSRADTGSGPYFARVHEDSNGNRDLGIGTFHDGWSQLLFTIDGSVTTVYPKDAIIKVSVSREDQFSVTSSQQKGSLTFKHVGSYERFVMKLFLVGTYLDRDNKQYVFRMDGQAEFAGQSVRYALDPGENDNLDRVKVGSDYYHFSRKGNRLRLSRSVGSATELDLIRTGGSDP